MVALFSHGLILIISLVCGIIFMILGLLFKDIILFDCIFISFIVGFVCRQALRVPLILIMAISLVVFIFLFWLQKTKAGFWMIGIILSLVVAFCVGFLAYIFWGQKMMGFYLFGGISFIVLILLHIFNRTSILQTSLSRTRE